MKSEFLLAITQLSAEKNLPKETVITAVESALVSAYRKEESFAPNQNLIVKINRTNGRVEVWAEKTVVEKVVDARKDITLADAKKLKADIQMGEVLMVEATPQNAGRIAAQTAKQVILQRLHEAEHSAIFEEYAGKSGDIVSAIIQRIEARQVMLDLGRAQAVLPPQEQIPTERYRIGQRIKVFMVEVAKTAKGPKVIVSRSHPELLKRLFELEIPEVTNGTVEIKSVAREAGYRSKVAVASRQPGIDPVGCCVGLRGIRIQNIVNELNGEKIDVVQWNADPATFIANALSPAQIVAVELHKAEGVASVIVPDKMLSLAIGKEGQNARLAAKLSNWKIDIKPASVWEAEREATKLSEEEQALAEREAKQAGEPVAVGIAVDKEGLPVPETVEEETSITEAVEEIETAQPVKFETQPVAVPKRELRFAEEILGTPARDDGKAKKKKKGVPGKERETEGPRLRKGRRQELDITVDEEDY